MNVLDAGLFGLLPEHGTFVYARAESVCCPGSKLKTGRSWTDVGRGELVRDVISIKSYLQKLSQLTPSNWLPFADLFQRMLIDSPAPELPPRNL